MDTHRKVSRYNIIASFCPPPPPNRQTGSFGRRGPTRRTPFLRYAAEEGKKEASKEGVSKQAKPHVVMGITTDTTDTSQTTYPFRATPPARSAPGR